MPTFDEIWSANWRCRPTPGVRGSEIVAIKRSFAACYKLTLPGVAQGEREMSLDIPVEFHDDVSGRIANNVPAIMIRLL
jgi:hypothetical protein